MELARLLVALWLGISIYCADAATAGNILHSDIPPRKANNIRSAEIAGTLEGIVRRLDEQEARILQLETVLSANVETIAEKDRVIENLSMRVADLEDIIGTGMSRKERSLPIPNDHQTQNESTNILSANETTPDGPNLSQGNYNGNENRSLQDEKHVKLLQSDRNTKFIGSSEHKHWSNRVGPTLAHDHIAFSVKMSADISLQPHEILKFNLIMTDTAHAFNTGTGMYVVPVSGVYVFTWSCTSGNNGNGAVWTSLRVDGISRSTTLADSPSDGSWGSSTGLIVISVNQGVSVYIRAELLGNIISDNRAVATFSGWRLF